MRIGLISSHLPATHDELVALRDYALALARHGLNVCWLCADDAAAALVAANLLVPAGEEALPPTCRYVIPCQPYGLDTVQVIGVEPDLWQQPALHTRLFTFLCLLQQARPCEVFHAWGDLSAAYVAVYTARFLGVPAVVTYTSALCHDGPQQAFIWQWVARHVAMAMVTSQADGERLLATSDLRPTQLQFTPLASSAVGEVMAALYHSLQRPT